MWSVKKQLESNGQTVKLTFGDVSNRVSYGEFLSQLRDSVEFRNFLSEQLLSVPFDAFRWETPPVTVATIEQSFECVLIASPELLCKPDPHAFADYFMSHSVDDIATFPNLRNDAVLVAP